ncbi:MAG: hypothetical protein AAF529_18910 [Pseudomonadota bacterium]
MKQFFCELLFICAAAAPGAQPLEDLAYGTVLYEYYQEDYQAALLTTLITEERGWQGQDPVRFELAKGSFAFADGMYGYASEILANVPEGELTTLDEMRLAFHLGREFHRRQDWPQLREQLAKIELGKSWFGRERTHPEVEYMRAEAAVAAGEFEAARQFYAAMDKESPLRAYGLFNLGVTLRSMDQIEPAKAVFQELADMPAYDAEADDLKQRARLAVAMLARQANNPTEAETVLAALPSAGRYQDMAMAAYGGLAMDTEDYELAARIFMTLKDEAHWTPSTASARLGFPLSLEKMAASGQRAATNMALNQYRAAEASFSARLGNLHSLMRDAEDPAWVHGLLEVFAQPAGEGRVEEARLQQMQALMDRWQTQLGHTDWLEWLATDEVHQLLVQWRELKDMQGWLQGLPGHLTALDELAHERQRRATLAKSLLEDDGLLQRRQELLEHAHGLQAEIQRVEAARISNDVEWMYPLADADERELLDELKAMESLIQFMDAQDQVKWSARLQRMVGVFFYRIVDERAGRLWALKKTHKDLLAKLEDIDQQVARMQVAEQNFVAGVGTDMSIFHDRAGELLAQVSAARDQRETMLAGAIRGRMRDEADQVEQYLLVTRIAIARATDLLAQVEMPVNGEQTP